MGFTVSLALADFIPVVLYIIAMLIVTKAMKPHMPAVLNTVLRISTVTVFVTGIIKASAKLLDVTGNGISALDSILDKYYFPSLVTLYFIAGVSVLISLTERSQKKIKTPVKVIIYSLLAVVFLKTAAGFADTGKNTMTFVMIMMIGNLLFWGCLSFFSFRNRIPAAGVLFIVTFVFLMYMGYMNTKDFSDAKTHWMAESVNITAQIFMVIASVIFGKKLKKQ